MLETYQIYDLFRIIEHRGIAFKQSIKEGWGQDLCCPMRTCWEDEAIAKGKDLDTHLALVSPEHTDKEGKIGQVSRSALEMRRET